jgi:hypothetical protein
MNTILNKLLQFPAYLNASPFSIIDSKFKRVDNDISDFFVFRLDGFETIFIAENNLALLSSELHDCQHTFNFFDGCGNFLSKFEISSNNFHYQLTINSEMTNGILFGGFTHHISYSDEILEKYKSLLGDISFQHRGYSGYRKNIRNGFSYTHGNFGGIYIDGNKKIRSIARSRGKHIYTAQFSIKPEFNYDFIYTNPLNRKTTIKFFLEENKSFRLLNQEHLNPLATSKFSLENINLKNEANISWQTNLPIGRCIVFEYNKSFFDVFHS